jgi:ubiquinone/menaquinone biosynthesis C-methylase UbiE
VLAIPVARRLPDGVLYAVDESPDMLLHLERRLSEAQLDNVRSRLIDVRSRLIRENNLIFLDDYSVDRVLAVNLLHEVVGESALQEMQRVLHPDGFLLVMDWRADVEREEGPSDEVSLTPQAGRDMLEEAAFEVVAIEDVRFPYHFLYLARTPSENHV